MKKEFESSMTSDEYITLMDKYTEEGRTSGPEQSEERINYTKLNRYRIHRLLKTIKFTEELQHAVEEFNRKMTWVVVTESWCGDGAQNLPLVQMIAEENDFIELEFILRDSNLDFIDKYLTNGGRSIPKIVAYDAETGEEVFTWGPRPERAQAYRDELTQKGLEKSEIGEELQRWYLKDRESALMQEFTEILERVGNAG